MNVSRPIIVSIACGICCVCSTTTAADALRTIIKADDVGTIQGLPLILAAELHNNGASRLRLAGFPDNAGELFVAEDGHGFEKRMSYKTSTCVLSRSPADLTIGPGECSRWVCLVLRVQCGDRECPFVFNSPGKYLVKLRMFGVDSNVMQVTVAADSDRERGVVKQFDNIYLPKTLLPINGIIGASGQVQFTEREIKDLKSMLQDSPAPAIADWIHLLLGICGPVRNESRGDLNRLDHLKSVSDRSPLMRALAAANMPFEQLSGPDLSAVLADFSKYKESLSWVCVPYGAQNARLRSLQPKTFTDERLERKVDLVGRRYEDVFRIIHEETGVELSRDDMPAEVVSPLSGMRSVRDVMVYLSRSGDCECNCYWVEELGKSYRLRCDHDEVKPDACHAP